MQEHFLAAQAFFQICEWQVIAKIDSSICRYRCQTKSEYYRKLPNFLPNLPMFLPNRYLAAIGIVMNYSGEVRFVLNPKELKLKIREPAAKFEAMVLWETPRLYALKSMIKENISNKKRIDIVD